MLSSVDIQIMENMPGENNDSGEACCGPSDHRPSDPYSLPGYEIEHFVKEFHKTGSGTYPVVSNELTYRDKAGTALTRMGYKRSFYKVSPGLYCSGRPGNDSHVFVTANYKISFDHLRRSLKGISAWILVLDTMGVNVWCAAGKKTFSTEEIAKRVQKTDLSKVVNHRKIVVPKLGAPGVSSVEVKRKTGFEVVWGPIYAKDIKGFIENGLKNEDYMNQLKFDVIDRIVLIPVELMQFLKAVLIISLILFLVSGFGKDIFSFERVLQKGFVFELFFLCGAFSGFCLTPLLLPFFPGRAFAVKGVFAALITLLPLICYFYSALSSFETVSMVLISLSVSSYIAMNFTGSTPFTSPSGVEKEMKRAIPLQILSVTAAVILWITSIFV